MRKYEYLSPTSRTMLHYIAATGIEAETDFGMPAIVIVMRKKGVAIGQTLAAIDECVAGGWLAHHRQLSRQPDRIALTSVAALTLRLQAAE